MTEKNKTHKSKKPERDTELTVEELEERVAPATAPKKAPTPAPYAPGTRYGLIRRDNLGSE